MAGDRSQEMRRMASECLALARQTSDPLVRFSRLELAQKWIDLAELSEHDPWNDALRRRALQAAIGQKLKDLYEASPDLPHHMLTILMQLNADHAASMEGNEILPPTPDALHR
jgi:precorrin-6x reductase